MNYHLKEDKLFAGIWGVWRGRFEVAWVSASSDIWTHEMGADNDPIKMPAHLKPDTVLRLAEVFKL